MMPTRMKLGRLWRFFRSMQTMGEGGIFRLREGIRPQVLRWSGGVCLDDFQWFGPDEQEGRAWLGKLPKPDRENILHDAERVYDHVFEILGTGAQHWGTFLDWHCDRGSGRRWPLRYFKRLFPVVDLTDDSDPKVPWELSRFQHIPTLGKAYWITDNERYASEFMTQIEDWIARNPCPYGINWTVPMEVAIRACNWIWGVYFFGRSEAFSEAFSHRLASSLAQHAWYILKYIEDWGEQSNNHYLADIVGLLFLGIVLKQHPEAHTWRDFALRQLARCMEKQVFEDGVSFENTIGYHRLYLELFAYAALLSQQNEVALPKAFWSRLERMFEFVMHYTQPNGRAPMIGDSDDGRLFILSRYSDWDRWDHRYLLSVGSVLFGRSDFKAVAEHFWEEAYWLFGPKGERAFFEVPAGQYPNRSVYFPDWGGAILRNEHFHGVVVSGRYQGLMGHCHADAGSFVLCSSQGLPIVVDPGTYTYTRYPVARNRFRSEALHNVLLISGSPRATPKSDGIWGWDTWRSVENPRWEDRKNGAVFTVVFSSYVSRSFQCSCDDGRFVIRDRFDLPESCSVIWHFHFLIEPLIEVLGSRCLEILGNDESYVMYMETSHTLTGAAAIRSDFSERYGVLRPAWCLEITSQVPVGFSETVFVFSGHKRTGRDCVELNES